MSRAYPFRDLLKSGSIIANGTDAPVEPASTMRTFYSAIMAEGRAMKRDEALASMTRWAAYACFLENEIGTIEVGKRADFVVMDRDWMTCEAEAILETKILATYVGGEEVYSA
jgi:predicted amidohydrolase YtcJ